MPSPISENASYSCGDVVAVPFRFSDKLAEKRRPALVVSNDELAQEGMIWLVMITTVGHRQMNHDVPVSNLDACGLNTACVIRPVKITAIEPERIIRRIGAIDDLALDTVIGHIRSLVGKPAHD